MAQQLLDRITLAQQLHDQTALESTVHCMWQRCGSVSEEHKKYLNGLFENLLQKLMPTPHKCVMWAAENSAGFFDVHNLEVEPAVAAMCRGPEGETESGPIHGVEDRAEGRPEDRPEETKEEIAWKEVAQLMQLPSAEHYHIYQTQAVINEIGQRIKRRVTALLETKNTLYEDLAQLDSVIEEVFVSRLTPAAAASFLVWAEKVSLFHHL